MGLGLGRFAAGRHGPVEDDEVFRLDRSRGVARACPFSIIRVVDCQALDRWRGGDRVEVLRSEFLDVLASVPTPRPRGRRYRLDGLLAIAILATAAGMGCYAGFATWAATRRSRCSPNWGSGFADRPRRRSERYFNDWIRRIGPPPRRLFHRAGRDRGSRRGQLAGGRSGRQDAARGASGRAAAAHLVSVFAHHARLALGQLAVAEKSNEIPCVRKILHPFGQVRLLLMVDAMHTRPRPRS